MNNANRHTEVHLSESVPQAAIDAAWDTAHAANQSHTEWKETESVLGMMQGTHATQNLTEAIGEVKSASEKHKRHHDILVAMAGVVLAPPAANVFISEREQPVQDQAESISDEPTSEPVGAPRHSLATVKMTPEAPVKTAESEQIPYVPFAEQLIASIGHVSLPYEQTFAYQYEAADNTPAEERTEEQKAILANIEAIEEVYIGSFALAEATTVEEYAAFKSRVNEMLNPTPGVVDGRLEDTIISALYNPKQPNQTIDGVRGRADADATGRRGMNKATLEVSTRNARDTLKTSLENSDELDDYSRPLLHELTSVEARNELPELDKAKLDLIVIEFARDIVGARLEAAKSHNIAAFESNVKILTERRGEIDKLIEDADTLLDPNLTFSSAHGRQKPGNIIRGLRHNVSARHERGDDKTYRRVNQGYVTEPRRATRLTRRLGYTLDRTQQALAGVELREQDAPTATAIDDNDF